MKKRRPIASPRLAASLSIVATLAFSIGCDGPAPATNGTKPPLVEAVEARYGTLPFEEVVHGVVRAENEVAVRAELVAPIAAVLVESGQAVRRGQILVRLEDDELEEQLRRAEADVRLAEANAAEAEARRSEVEARVRRSRSLQRDGLLSAQELESLEAELAAERASVGAASARVDQAVATANERRSSLAKTLVRSPSEGRIGARNAEVGMLVDRDTVLFRVGNLDRLRIEVPLHEAMLERVRAGQPVSIHPRGDGRKPIDATLSRVSPFLEEASFTTVGEIDVADPGGRLRPGMFVTVRILHGESEEATLVPASALWQDPGSGGHVVLVVDDAEGLADGSGGADPEAASRRVSLRAIDVLAAGQGTLGVDGVTRGEWVVVAGHHLVARRERRGESIAARVRPITWDRVRELQERQREDLLEDVMDKQRRIARALGAEIPASEAEVERVLAKGGD